MLVYYKFLKFCFRYVVPSPWRYPLARWIARVDCRLNRRRRDVLVGNLTPLVGGGAAPKLAPQMLGNFCMTAVDFFCAPPDLPRRVHFNDWPLLERIYRETKRVMLVTAHVGHWEIGISCVVEKGYPMAGVYAPYREDAVVQWILSHRNANVEWIPATPGAAEHCVGAIKKGRVLGMVADIPFGERGRRVWFHGHAARLPIGPWAIAALARATVIPTFIIRRAPGEYRGTFHAPIRPVAGSLREQIVQAQDIYIKHLEYYLNSYPTQWGVLQPFWEPATPKLIAELEGRRQEAARAQPAEPVLNSGLR
jgi:lauroyl/myristoyl acyltransferase